MESNGKERLRIPIIFFGLFIAVLLYQPEGLGTYVALGTMLLLILSCILSKNLQLNKFRFPAESKIILVYLLISIFVTVIHNGFPTGFYRYVAQIILFIILANIKMNEREYAFIKGAFLISTCFYSIVALQYCITNQSTRFYHGDIVLFGASFDPNFIGISFITASVFLLDNVLKGKKRIPSGIGLILIYVTIVYTASRGNFLSALVGGILVFFIYLRDKKIKMVYRIFWCVVVLVIGLLAARYFAEAFPTQWERISQLNAYEDNGRFRLWNESVQLISRHPLIGNGVRSMYQTFSKASHNTYLQVLVENGIIGLVLFSAFIAKLFKKARNYDRTLAVALIAMLVQIFFLDAFDNRCVWAVLCWIAMVPRRRCIIEDEEVLENREIAIR